MSLLNDRNKNKKDKKHASVLALNEQRPQYRFTEQSEVILPPRQKNFSHL